jgi:hypothetical protein
MEVISVAGIRHLSGKGGFTGKRLHKLQQVTIYCGDYEEFNIIQ